MSSKRPKKKVAGLTYEEFRREIEEGRLGPLYLFVGEEQLLQDRAVSSLVETIDEGSRIYNVFFYSIGMHRPPAPKVTIARAIDTANERAKENEQANLTQQANLFSRRIVVVRSFENIKEEESELLYEYLKRPMPTTALVFQAASLDQRRKISSALLKFCTVVSFDRPSEQRLAQLSGEYLKQLGCQIMPEALRRLTELVGNDMIRIKNELDKLDAYAGGEVITEAAVLELVPRSREHTNWELWDAIIRRDGNRAMRLIKRLLDDGDTGAPLMVLGALAGLYRRMLAGKEMLDGGASFDEFARAIGQWREGATNWKTRLSRTPRAEIVHGLHRIAQVDNAIKNAEATPRLQMEYLVAELILPRTRPKFA